MPTPDEAYIEALLLERAGYVNRNLPDRVADVDAELARVGYKTPRRAAAEPTEVEAAVPAGDDVERAVPSKRRGR